MSLSTSPALKQVESSTGVPVGAFAEKNYHSVFDVIRQSRKQFITANASWLGSRGGKAWDLAMGQAQYIRRLFRENQLTRGVRQGLPRTLSGQPTQRKSATGGIQGLVQDGPDWQNQFGNNWQAFCQSGSPEAYDSPVSYLTWLYGQALSFEQEMRGAGGAIISLDDRRPDLATMMIDNDAVSQVIPALQLVNEILEDTIAPGIASGNVGETLASTRYPTLLPYHFPHDQTELSLQNAGVSLEGIIGQTSTDWPWFLNGDLTGTHSNNATELSSRLAPGQQTIITEPAPTDWVAFYLANLGLPTATDYTPFEDTNTFMYQLGITVPRMEQLIAGNAGGTTVTLSSNNVFWHEDTLAIRGDIVSGYFGSALSLYNRKNSCAFFEPDSAVATAMKGDKSFSIGMWIYCSASPTDNQIPIISNCLPDGKSQGISVCRDSNGFKIEIADTANHAVTSTLISSTVNTWGYLCLTWDITTKTPTLWYQEAGASTGTSVTVEPTTLTEDVITKDGFTWVLNDSGDFSYYSTQHPTPATMVNCLYDDIGVFSGVLTASDVQKLASSTTPLPEITGLSLAYVAYFNLDNAEYSASSEYYGASFINAGKAPSVQLSEIFYDARIETVTGENATSGAGSAGYAPSESVGKISSGMKLFGTKQNFLQLGSQATTALSGAADFTLGFWFFLNAFPADSVSPVVSNCLNYNSGKTGFGLGIKQTGQLYATVQSSVPDDYTGITSDQAVKLNTWYYLTFQWEVATYGLTLSVSENGATPAPKTSAISDKTGSVVPDTGTAWTFNESGSCNFYTADKVNPFSFVVDDICIWEKLLTAADIQAVAADSSVAGGRTDMAFHYPLDTLRLQLSNLSDPCMDRINRMVRLQRWLELSYEETDLLLSACIAAQGANNTDYTLNTHTLRALGVFRHWQQKYDVTAFQFGAVLHQITPYAISPAVPFLDQVFNSPSLFDEPFAITGATVKYGSDADDNSEQIISQLCAGTCLTRAQFRVLADKVAAQQGSTSAHTFPLTLDVVSAFYRLTMIPRWLGLSFAEGASLFSLLQASDGVWTTLASIPQLTILDASSGQPTGGDILDTLMALDAAAGWAKEHGLSWVKNYLELQPTPEKLIATAATANIVNGIKQQLPATLLSEQSFIGIPQPTSWLAFPNGYTQTDGIVNQGIQLSSSVGQYARFSAYANHMANGSTSYTLGFWLQTSATETNIDTLGGNADYVQEKSGIYAEVLQSLPDLTQNLFFGLYSDSSESAGVMLTNYPGEWEYVALVLNTEEKSLNACCISSSSGAESTYSISYTNFTGSIIAPDSMHWCLCQDGTQESPLMMGGKTLLFDDVTLWNRALTHAEITDIATSGKMACLSVPAAVSEFTDWMTVLDDLVDSNGLVRDISGDYDTIYARVKSDIAWLVFEVHVDVDLVADTLAGIIYQAMLTQNGIADSALAQRCNTQQALSPYLYHWAGDSEYRLLSDTLALNNGDVVTDPAVITADVTYLPSLYALEQRAEIASQFSLTPAALSTFLAHPGWLKSGLTDLTPTLTLFWLFGAYSDWLQQSIKEDAVLAYLSRVNADSAPASGKAASALAALLDADSDEVALATAVFSDGIAKTVADVADVMRLLSLTAQTGLSVTPLLEVGTLTPGGVTDTWDAWQTVGNALVAAQTVGQ